MRELGRLLQLVALVVLPLSMYLELTGSLGRSFGLSQMVLMMLFGMCSFAIGRMLESFGRGST